MALHDMTVGPGLHNQKWVDESNQRTWRNWIMGSVAQAPASEPILFATSVAAASGSLWTVRSDIIPG
jgi:hypothetical protein